jgi:DNA-binding transcriptional MerR regulator
MSTGVPGAAQSDDAPRWRVEELARRTAVSVDTIRFYQKRRLLEPPVRDGRVAWYGPAHEARLTQIRELRREGFTLAMIGRLLDGELTAVDLPLAAAVADADTEEFLTAAELADRSGVPPALIDAVIAEGLLLPRVHEGEACFTAADIEVIQAGLSLLEAGLPLTALLDLARRHHAATQEVAETAVALFDEHVRRPLLTAELADDERAARLVDAFRRLLPATGTLVEHHFRRVLLRVAQDHLESVGDESERAAAERASARRIETVGPQ